MFYVGFVFDQNRLNSFHKAVYDDFVDEQEIGFGFGSDDDKTDVNVRNVRANKTIFARSNVFNDETVAILCNLDVISDVNQTVVFKPFSRKANLDALVGVNEKF